MTLFTLNQFSQFLAHIHYRKFVIDSIVIDSDWQQAKLLQRKPCAVFLAHPVYGPGKSENLEPNLDVLKLKPMTINMVIR